MKTFDLAVRSISDIHKLGTTYLLTWCFFYKSEADRSSRLLEALTNKDFGDLPTCLAMLRIQDNPWVGIDMSVPKELPELMCFSCGGGICRVNSMDELEESVAMAKNMGEQLQASWLSQTT
jgi:hypothetical protein